MPTRHFLTISLLAFVSCFFFAGCETGEPGVTTSQSRGSALTSGASIPYHYSQMVELRWVDASVGSRLVRTQGTSEVLAQEDFGGAGLHPLLQEQGQDTALASRTRFGGVVPTVLFGKDPGRNSTVEITWTFPSHDSERPALLQIPGSPPVTLSSNTVTVRYEIENITYKIFVNGEFIEERNYPVGAGVVQVPAFSSFVSGPHAITVVGTGTPDAVDGTWNYNQKKLVFAQETHDFDLDSDEPIEIVNSFGWDNGSPAVDPHWRLTLGGFNGFVKEGTGTEVQATWDPKNLILTQAEELEEISLNLTGFAEGYPGTEYIGGADGSVPSSKTGLQIVNETITPDPPFEEPGSSVMLTATAVLIDSELDTSDIMWTVDLEDSNGEPVVEEFESGNGPEIIAEWDGTVNGQPVDEPTTYQFHIYAEVCPNDGGGQASRAIRAQDGGSPMCDDDDKVVAMLGGTLKVFRSGETTNEIANSRDNPKSSTAGDPGLKRLRTVNAAESWRIDVEGLNFGTGQPPETLAGFAVPSVSPQVSFPLTLTDADAQGNKNGVYSVEFDPNSILKSGSELSATQFSVGAGVTVNFNGTPAVISHLYADLLVQFIFGANFYPMPKKELGRLVYTGISKLENGQSTTEIGINEAEFNKSNIKHFGFEAISINVLTPGGLIEAVVKVQNKAPLYSTFCHGGFDGKLLLFAGPDGQLDPSDLTDAEVDHLETWVFNACNVLICYDYNNNLANRNDLGRQGPGDPISARASGAHGIRWWTKLNRGQTILLGYNYPVQVDEAALAVRNYKVHLDDSALSIEGADVDASNKQQWAWMVANAKVGGTAWNACVWDSDFYYYLAKYDPKYGKDPQASQASVYGIVRLPLNASGVPTKADGTPFIPNNPQGPPLFAPRFPIP